MALANKFLRNNLKQNLKYRIQYNLHKSELVSITFWNFLYSSALDHVLLLGKYSCFFSLCFLGLKKLSDEKVFHLT
jgi:hypothetical protein